MEEALKATDGGSGPRAMGVHAAARFARRSRSWHAYAGSRGHCADRVVGAAVAPSNAAAALR